jgi:uncharacterized membrane protein YqjE
MPVDRGRSFADVLQDIVANIQDIVRAELRLATTEIKQEAAKAADGGRLLGAGAVAALFAVAFLLLSAVYGLALVMPVWAASLTVAVLLAVISAILIGSGRTRLKSVHAPKKTVASIRETLHG